jgi:hypothetical protein
MEYLQQAPVSVVTPHVSLILPDQEARKRGLRFTYCTVNGHQIGAPV